ncbi:type I-E CRISPR-associated protein Cse2/CasB [Azospirillum sp. BE72]|uniref:type I-E CRISPR-associated protein Cse2/CasB n=1 Tax=Azospirillum sp. BE72 TaxID=2817776 RepID=UPI002864E09F|nr:type I-E CRISPR-associated protein Cse2/CasB [Azospirillum sp. BE72]MDR6771501.1 CRISPR type I-E-associated protein CasB/Cse2 [Azospirillum sp. BE72]
MTTTQPMPPPDTAVDGKAPPTAPTMAEALAALARRFADPDDHGKCFDSGLVARLRRLPAGTPAGVDVWRALYDGLGADRADALLSGRSADRVGAGWALVLHGMALMAPGPHRQGRRAGEALAEAGFSETRLTQLLRADADGFPDHFATACRFLRAKGEEVDWTEFGQLALKRLGLSPGYEAAADRIARDYVRILHRAAKQPEAGA